MTGTTSVFQGIGARAAGLLIFALTLLLMPGPARALSEVYCGDYANQAVEQSREYVAMQCTGGLSEWWNVKTDIHRNWCVTLPEGSPLPRQGTADRQAVLDTCRLATGTAGTLVVHNNTDATLEVYVTYLFNSSLTTRSIFIPPVSRAKMVILFGRSELVATAVQANDQPRITVPVSIYRNAEHEVELFASDFGVSMLTDVALASDCHDLVPGKWEWFANGVVTIERNGSHRQGTFSGRWDCEGDTVYMEWSHGYVDVLRLSLDGMRLAGTGDAVDPNGPQGYPVSGQKLQ